MRAVSYIKTRVGLVSISEAWLDTNTPQANSCCTCACARPDGSYLRVLRSLACNLALFLGQWTQFL